MPDSPAFQARRFAPPDAWLGVEGRFVERCPSSNDMLWQWIQSGAPHGAVVVAGEQTEGRGRQGRRWQSEAGQGLYFSCYLRPLQPRGELSAFGLAAATAVADAIESLSAIVCALKWPNDLLVGRRKLAGLLLEARSQGDGLALVLGVGLNLRPPRLGWGAQLEGKAVALAELGCEQPAERWASELCGHLGRSWDAFARAGLAPFHAAFARRDCLRNQPISYDWGGEVRSGVAEGIDADGALLLRDASGQLQRLLAGEVHLRESGAR